MEPDPDHSYSFCLASLPVKDVLPYRLALKEQGSGVVHSLHVPSITLSFVAVPMKSTGA